MMSFIDSRGFIGVRFCDDIGSSLLIGCTSYCFLLPELWLYDLSLWLIGFVWLTWGTLLFSSYPITILWISSAGMSGYSFSNLSSNLIYSLTFNHSVIRLFIRIVDSLWTVVLSQNWWLTLNIHCLVSQIWIGVSVVWRNACSSGRFVT